MKLVTDLGQIIAPEEGGTRCILLITTKGNLTMETSSQDQARVWYGISMVLIDCGKKGG